MSGLYEPSRQFSQNLISREFWYIEGTDKKLKWAADYHEESAALYHLEKEIRNLHAFSLVGIGYYWDHIIYQIVIKTQYC